MLKDSARNTTNFFIPSYTFNQQKYLVCMDLCLPKYLILSPREIDNVIGKTESV